MIGQIPEMQILPHSAKAVVNFLSESMQGIRNTYQLLSYDVGSAATEPYNYYETK